MTRLLLHRVTFYDELEGFSNVVSLFTLLLDSEHHPILQKLAVLHHWNVSRSQHAQIDRSVHVHTPSSSLFHVFTKPHLLLHGHLAITTEFWVAAAISAAFDFLVEAALSGCASRKFSLAERKKQLSVRVLADASSTASTFLLRRHLRKHFLEFF